MKRNYILLILLLISSFTYTLTAQLTPHYQWTLLNQSEIDEIIGEASGERAYNHVIEMVGYTRDRKDKEYQTTLHEGQYVVDQLKAYGISNAKIDRYPGASSWDGIKGELWEISPRRSKLADFDDLCAMLASGSANANVEAELIWVEEGSEDDIKNLDVSDKIIVTSGSVGRAAMVAAKYGAIGVVSFNSPRPLVDPIQIPWSGIYSRRGGEANEMFGFMLPPREGHILRDRLLRGEKIRVHAVVEAKNQEFDLQVPTCVIEGTNPDAQEIIFSAHIFEGYKKQGANDNCSGSAAILEIARVLNTLYAEGRLPKPQRNIRFIWVPEFSGTIPWVKDHQKLMEKTLCNINLDMVGLCLKESESFLNMERTTFSNPHYLNDVMENYYRYVGETNRVSLVLNGRSGYLNRIVAPSGSDDPFYYNIEAHYGASDHEVFNDWAVGVPGIMMITWPDNYYHTSEDAIDKLDPTQLKRVAFIGAAAAHTIACADHAKALKISGEVLGNASRRMGHQLSRALDELDRSNSENFTSIYKKTRSYIEASLINEKQTLKSVEELAEIPEFEKYINKQTELLEQMAEPMLLAIDQLAEEKAKQLNLAKTKIRYSNLEKKAIDIIPVATSKVKENGYGGYREAMNAMTSDRNLQRDFYRNIANTSELCRLCNGDNNALEIKKMLDTQYNRSSDLQTIITYIELLKKSGLVSY